MTRDTSLHEGVVLDNNDPDNRLRLKVRVFGVHDDRLQAGDLPWCVCGAYAYTGNQHGELRRPNVGSNVFVTFKNGDLNYPVWTAQPLYSGDRQNTDDHSKINGNYRLDVRQQHESNVWGGADFRVGGADYRSVGRSQRIVVGSNRGVEVAGNQTTQVKGALSLIVKGAASLDVGSWTARTGGPVQFVWGASETTTVAGDSTRLVIGATSLRAASYTVESSEGISLKNPTCTLTFNLDGTVTIAAAQVVWVDAPQVNLGAGPTTVPPGDFAVQAGLLDDLDLWVRTVNELANQLITVAGVVGVATLATAAIAAQAAGLTLLGKLKLRGAKKVKVS